MNKPNPDSEFIIYAQSGATLTAVYNTNTKHFQQRMSWLPYRWRTQRNAIRNANCKIQWVIKTLNASCTSLGEYVCWSVCLNNPLPLTESHQCWIRFSDLKRPGSVARLWVRFYYHDPKCEDENTNVILRYEDWLAKTSSFSQLLGETWHEKGLVLFSRVSTKGDIRRGLNMNISFIRTSNQARIPAEFKHITRRRKRN